MTVLQFLEYFPKFSEVKTSFSFPKSWCLPSFYLLGTGGEKGGLPTLVLQFSCIRFSGTCIPIEIGN